MLLRSNLLSLHNQRLNSFGLLHRRCYAIQNVQNQPIVDLLRKHKQEEQGKVIPNHFKLHAFTKAIKAINNLGQPILSGADISKLPGIGSGIVSRIDEHFYQGLEEDSTQYKEVLKSRAVTLFQNIRGIGKTTAKRLVDAGCLSLSDLSSKRFSHLLSAKQSISLKYFSCVGQPLQRQDIEDVVSFCRESLGPKYEIVPVGPYRRGASSPAEIQVMLLHPDFVHVPIPTDPPPFSSLPRKKGPKTQSIKSDFLQNRVISRLQQRGLVADAISLDWRTWRGVVRLPGSSESWGERLERRSAIASIEGRYTNMTVHLTSPRSQGAALITFTGDTDFYTDVVKRAQQLGMLFNAHGLWRWNPSDTADLEQGYWSFVQSSSEQDIFDELGIEFVDPLKRNFGFLSSKTPSQKKKAPPSEFS